MSHHIALSNLAKYKYGIVFSVASEPHIEKRLRDIGIIKGARIRCVLSAPCGNPRAYEIKGAVIALRNEDCADITVSTYDAPYSIS